MGYFGSFGDWARRRRKILDITQAELARQVSCSLSMLRKIERDERRPSEQLAELLADRLGIDDAQRTAFLNLARGKFVLDIPEPIHSNSVRIPALTEFVHQSEEPAPFVARERQLQLLHEHLGRAMQGQGRMVFIIGEAGRGKTSLLAAFARQAMDAQPDLIAVGGSCDVYTGQSDPLLPFRDIFRLLVGDLENASLPGIVNRQLAERLAQAIPLMAEILLSTSPHLIGTLLPEAALESCLVQISPHNSKNMTLVSRLQSQRALTASAGLQDLRQDYLFDEISTAIKAFAQQRPLLLLLDDLHWIDPSSAALLGHLAMRLKHCPILIVGSFRPEDLAQRRTLEANGGQAQHPLQDVLSESLRQFGQNRIDLDHSDPDEALNFVNALLDVDDNAFGEAFKKQLARLTEGHPLFVVELLRDMRERGDIILREDGRWHESTSMHWKNFPARVEGVIEKRIARLPADLLSLLNVACVQGETFFTEVISQVARSDPLELAHRFSAEADRQHRLIHEQGVRQTGTGRLSQYRFRHHLFQKYLYGRLAAAERMYLHEAVGNALEALLQGSLDEEDLLASQLARHFQEARLDLKASKYLFLSGQQAVRVLAFGEAALHFERGLSLLKGLTHTPEVSHLEYELSLALAQALWHHGRVAEAVTAYQNTIEIARSLDDPTALARAALAYEQPRWRLNLDAERSQGYLRQALAALEGEQSGLRVRLLVGLSRTLLDSGEKEELGATVDQALRIARQIDDPLALCDALRIKAHIDRRPETTAARLTAVQEMIATAKSIGEQERLADGFDLYIYDLLELGQIDRVDEMIEAHRQLSEEIKQPFQLHIAKVFQTMRSLLRGEFEKAEQLANEAAKIAEQIGIAGMDGIFGLHMFTIRREQGRIGEIAPIVKFVVENNVKSSAWRPGLALIYSILGQKKECQEIFEDLVSAGFAFVPQDSLWVATLAYLSEVCTFLEDRDRAATLYELLLPYRGRSVVVGAATVCFGAAARYLGMLAKTMSDWESAERHFQEAAQLEARMQAWPWLAHSQCEHAAMWLERGRTQDRQPAKALLDEASRAALSMGMAHLAGKVAGLQVHYGFGPT